MHTNPISNTNIIRTLSWNLLDSVGSQALLVMYHTCIRAYAGPVLHGALGATLSLFYLALIVINGGLDYSIAPFFKHITQDKKSAGQFFRYCLVPQWQLLIGVAICFYGFAPLLLSWLGAHLPGCYVKQAQTLSAYSNSWLVCWIALTLVSEGVKKSCKVLLQLKFYTRLTACVEFGGLLIYALTLAATAWYTGTLTLELCWGLLCFYSYLEAGCLVYTLYQVYQTLPVEQIEQTQTPARLYRRLTVSRFFTLVQQLSGQLFSGNVLVPLCAVYLGLDQASFLKVITSFAHWVTLIAYKVFGVSSSAFLAQAKHLSLEKKRAIFLMLSDYLQQALYALGIFLMINQSKLVMLQHGAGTISLVSWSTLYLMLIVSFCESFFVVYEKWYIIEERIGWLALINLCSFGVIYALVYHLQCTQDLSQIALFSIILTVRLCAFALLTVFSFYQWGLLPAWRPRFKTLAIALGIALTFYLLV